MSTPAPKSSEHLTVASILVVIGKNVGGGFRALGKLPPGYSSASGAHGRHFFAYRLRTAGTGATPGRSEAPHRFVLGDPSEIADDEAASPTGNATTLECDLERGNLEIVTSIPGLPALYLLESADALIVTSDLFLLRCVSGVSLRFDPAGVRDFAHVGRPVGYRTLFAGVRMLPGGSRVSVRGGGGPTITSAWVAPPRAPCATWDEYTQLQRDAFGRSMARLDLRDTMLSLSSGLDSRTTLAGLIATGATASALTVSGDRLCLDARTASALCKAYGIDHQVIKLGSEFRRALPELATKSSLLSGGISSIWHAAQVYCYQVLGDPPPLNALSGYLGNQIGRRGTEGLTPRAADTSLLSPGLAEKPQGTSPWYAAAMQPDGFLEPQFLIQQESTFGNLASYQIGNAHSIQQSAYAFRPLIENLWRIPTAGADASRGTRIWNLTHLFLGEPVAESFQRQYINGVGGLVANYPINWGWRSKGGVSPTGVLWGSLALLDILVTGRLAHTPAAKISRMVGVAGLHEYRPAHEWLQRDMKSFVHDELLSQCSREAGLFVTGALEQALREFHSAGTGFKEIVLALDLALAARHFSVTA